MLPLFRRRSAKVLYHHRCARRTTLEVLVLLVQLVGPAITLAQQSDVQHLMQVILRHLL